MDKRKVISAYFRGFITLQECAQILGLDAPQVVNMINDSQFDEQFQLDNGKKSVNE